MRLNKNLSEYRCIIWDYNGTLLNDLQYSIDTMNSLLAERALPLLDTERYRRIFDFPVINYYKALGFDFKQDPFEKIGLEFIARYNKGASNLQIRETALQLLKKFKENGFQQYILTARKEEALLEELENLGIKSYFEAVAGLRDNYAAGKTERGKALFEVYDIVPKDCFLIGDTTHDSEVAYELGIDCVLSADGHHSKEKLLQTQHPVVETLDDLLKLIEY